MTTNTDYNALFIFSYSMIDTFIVKESIMNLTLLLLSIIFSLINADCGGEFKIICYFSSWTGIHPEAKNCTHIVYTFARIEDDNTLTGKYAIFLCIYVND
jgi:hypothetical protein